MTDASTVGGARLDPEVRAFVRRCAAAFPSDFRERPLDRQRALYRDLCRAFDAPRPAGLVVDDRTIADGRHAVPVRLYRPAARAALPCLLYLHGGGWIFGDLESHDGIAAELAARAQVAVVAVGYRLAPEHPYPAALQDCALVLRRLAATPAEFGIDASRVAVGGDSAGANLAAALCLLERDRGGAPLCGQFLIYPHLDLLLAVTGGDPDAPGLTRAETLYYDRLYLGGATGTRDPYSSPLLAGDLSALPPAYVQAVEHDPLRPGAVAYAERLSAAGVTAELWVAPGLVHGSLRARHASRRAARAFARLCRALRALLRDQA